MNEDDLVALRDDDVWVVFATGRELTADECDARRLDSSGRFVRTPAPQPASYHISGYVVAELNTAGELTDLYFCPGMEPDVDQTNGGDAEAARDNVKDVTGPFWRQIQRQLGTVPVIGWKE